MTYTIRDATDDDLPVIKRVLYEAVAWDTAGGCRRAGSDEPQC